MQTSPGNQITEWEFGTSSSDCIATGSPLRDWQAHGRQITAQTPKVATPGITGWDEKYAYDGLYQVTQRQRGDLNTARTSISGTPVREEQFAYDPAGNWQSYTTKAAGALTLDQRRAHNDLNQITALSTANTPWDPDTTPLASDKTHHDANGNQLLLPHGADGDWAKSLKLTWDAWNRLVKVANANDNTEIATYQYDGLWRRTTKKTATETRHYYYNDQWRSIEEHIEKADQTHTIEQQHLWGPHHRWQYHRRDRDTNPTDATHALTETLYALKDAMSITAVVDTTGTIKERYQYSAFGQRLCLSPTGTSLTESAFAWMVGFHVEFVDAGGAGKADTGLVNYGYRYYDVGCGRWLGRDVIEEEAGLNLFRYCYNNTSLGIDFLGLDYILLNRNDSYHGHNGGLIGNDKDGYDYYSKDGGHAKRTTFHHYKSKKEFDEWNKEKLDKNQQGQGYQQQCRVKTTPEQDAKMRAEAEKQKDKEFKKFTNNCSHLQCQIQDAAGIRGPDPDSITATGKYNEFVHYNTFVGPPDPIPPHIHSYESGLMGY